jgi:hypothetical protein
LLRSSVKREKTPLDYAHGTSEKRIDRRGIKRDEKSRREAFIGPARRLPDRRMEKETNLQNSPD